VKKRADDISVQNIQRGSIVVYDSPEGEVHIDVRIEGETVWLTQEQMSELFGRERSVITKHIRNVYKESELSAEATCAKFAHVRIEGEREVSRFVEYYNLDVIISVGYRVKSLRGTQFRVWATTTLREHLTKGYTLYRHRVERNARELERVLELVRATSQEARITTSETIGLLDVITRYSRTFNLLQRFDLGDIENLSNYSEGSLPTAAEAREAIQALKKQLMQRHEASDLFGREREGGLDGILGNLQQSVFGNAAYPGLESKAAHLLYFVIKNHPFADGNKRIGSLLFVDVLRRNNHLFVDSEPIINNIGLTALALLIAGSDPKDKDIMVKLVMHMLRREHHG